MKTPAKFGSIIVVAVLFAAVILAGGCKNDAQTGALIGSAIGAAAGAGIDHNNRGRGAAIGAAAGAGTGYVIGNERDKNQKNNQY
jgi:uncharacterized protein YcfJ